MPKTAPFDWHCLQSMKLLSWIHGLFFSWLSRKIWHVDTQSSGKLNEVSRDFRKSHKKSNTETPKGWCLNPSNSVKDSSVTRCGLIDKAYKFTQQRANHTQYSANCFLSCRISNGSCSRQTLFDTTQRPDRRESLQNNAKRELFRRMHACRQPTYLSASASLRLKRNFPDGDTKICGLQILWNFLSVIRNVLSTTADVNWIAIIDNYWKQSRGEALELPHNYSNDRFSTNDPGYKF